MINLFQKIKLAIAVIILLLMQISCKSKQIQNQSAVMRIINQPTSKVFQKGPSMPKTVTSAALKLLIKKRISRHPEINNQPDEIILGLGPGISGIISPVVPLRWPIVDDTIIYYVYEIYSLPTGKIMYSVRGPTHRITFTKPYDALIITEYKSVKEIGHFRSEGYSAEFKLQLEKEENLVLAQIIHLSDSVSISPLNLSAYAEWLRINKSIGEDIANRNASFFKWLRGAPAEQ